MEQPVLSLNDGRSMPQLGLGVWRVSDEDAEAVVGEALRCGYRAVDTASMYGNEKGVGKAVRAAEGGRESVFVTTKVWNDSQGYDAAQRSLDVSLRRLGFTSVDLFLIHWPSPSLALYRETWRALIKARDDGRARSIGVSNFEIEHLERIIGDTGIIPAVNQVELHPRFQQTALRAFHERHGIRTECWRPLGKGDLLDDPQIETIARKHGRTTAQVIIRWHMQSGLIAIPKSQTPSRIASNLNVFDFTLDETDMATFAAMDRTTGRMGANPAAG